MSPESREVAAHVPLPGLVAVRLFGGPWDGRDVWVRDPQARLVLVHGPRHGDHRVWITHTYERRDLRLEFVSTEVIPLSAALAWTSPR
jgi:hypothetical protein